ncbi:bZIP transcription factor, bZIP-1 [Ascosphaera apis ARSEF 7405]|uniref:BZIP transcription factor, bZIP-1 n=1 Tax=Ascosphaera apis ARSEF 7405 TaxID=392613 RepID=A0A168AL38_9EURO|nr:bZIP transcription factor, bZIP-1 [Ascosphaera apis ARSEF 7405]
MATLAAEPLAAHNGGPNGSFENVDLDAYINFDQPIYPSPSASLSPESQNNKDSGDKDSDINKEGGSEDNNSQQNQNDNRPSVGGNKVFSPSNNDISTQSSSPSTAPKANTSSSSKPNNFIAMPSHEYEQFKQQTGLPPGALANTFAMNMSSQPHLGSGGYGNGMAFSHGGFGMGGVPGMNLGMPMNSVGMNAMGFNGVQCFVPPGMGFSTPGAGMMTPGAGATGMNLGGVGLGGMPMTPGAGMYGNGATAPNTFATGQGMQGATAAGFGAAQQQSQQPQQRQYPQDAWGLDFNANPTMLRNDGLDIDLDDAAPPNTSSGEKQGQFVDPNAINSSPLSPDLSPSSSGTSTQVGRMYPGMHSQQAAMAKAAAEQRRAQQAAAQQEMVRRQQEMIKAHQLAQIQMQQGQLPGPAMNKSLTKQPLQSTISESDPIVESRISRLLNTMRQTASDGHGNISSDIPAAKPTPLHITRTKKDEDEMDEDERLLASEEGKKLSSKERRQLRNKVSARAFRSRRKEYIGQLEGEVAAKTNEANDLRMHNRALVEENARLTELTRMLLSAPQFASFLNEYSDIPPPSQNQTQQQQQQQLQQQQRNAIAAVVHSQAQQAQAQNQVQGQVPMLPSQNSHSQSQPPAADSTPDSFNFASAPMQNRPNWSAPANEMVGAETANVSGPTVTSQQSTATVFSLTDVEYNDPLRGVDANGDVLGSLMGFGSNGYRDNVLTSARGMDIDEAEEDDL